MNTVVYDLNAHVEYWVTHEKTGNSFLVSGRIVEIDESPEETVNFLIKRDHLMISNIGMYELDKVSHRNIVGYVSE